MKCEKCELCGRPATILGFIPDHPESEFWVCVQCLEWIKKVRATRAGGVDNNIIEVWIQEP